VKDRIVLDLCGEHYEKHIYYDHKGYALFYVNGREVKLHLYIWESIYGPKPIGYEIHHKDFNKGNYHPDNLELLNHSDHQRIHAGWIRDNEKWTHKPCNGCHSILPLNQFYYANTVKKESALCKNCHNEAIKQRNKSPGMIQKLRIYKREYYRHHYGKGRYKQEVMPNE